MMIGSSSILVRQLLKSFDYAAVTFPSATAFLHSPSLDETACLVADVQMPGMTGVELYGRLNREGRSIPTILITAHPDDGVRKRALDDGVVCYLKKPFAEEDLIRCIRAALEGRWPLQESSD